MREVTRSVAFEDIDLPEQTTNEAFLGTIRGALDEGQIANDKRTRLIHAAGKSFRDLWLLRHGIVKHAPDCVVFPESEEDVAAIVRAADEHGAVLIPFGGGSNIAGCLEPRDHDGRMVVSLDMCRMHRVLEVDQHSLTARDHCLNLSKQIVDLARRRANDNIGVYQSGRTYNLLYDLTTFAVFVGSWCRRDKYHLWRQPFPFIKP